MSSRQKSPPEFSHLVNLAEDLTGSFVVYASDDYFADKENLIRPDAPQWIEDKYTDKGKWMDGWESQRRRTPGHDHCIVRLGTAGFVHGVVVDTTWFRGNAPTHVELETVEAAHTATAEELNALTTWTTILDHTAIHPHTANLLPLPTPSTTKATHVRLRIFPDGGVARLRVFGVVAVDERTFWRGGCVDLAAIENGGTIATVSDEFFGPPSNLLLPGRGVNMGDGWETRRRRSPGSDWCVIKLGRRAVIERIEVDTAFFKGNAPQSVVVEFLDEETLSTERLRAGGFSTLVGKTALVPHRRHTLEPDRPATVTHLRVHIFPHGGVNRLRVFGNALDTSAETTALGLLNRGDHEVFLSLCGSKSWATAMRHRPASSIRALFEHAADAYWQLSEADLLEAFAAHPQIGERMASASATTQSAEWSTREQSAAAASAATSLRLAELNAHYLAKFGFIYIVFAFGKTADLMLEILETRLHNDRASEIENAAREQMKITRSRLETWLRTTIASLGSPAAF